MTVLMVATIKGDPDDLEERYRRQQPLLVEEFGGPPPGYLVHTCARVDDGLLVVNLVESEDVVHETRPRFEQTAQAVGLPDPDIEIHPVVNALAAEAFGPFATAE